MTQTGWGISEHLYNLKEGIKFLNKEDKVVFVVFMMNGSPHVTWWKLLSKQRNICSNTYIFYTESFFFTVSINHNL